MYNKEKLIALLCSEPYKAIADHGKLRPPSDGVYKKISEAMHDAGSEIGPKHVYTILNTNRCGIYQTVCDAFNIQNINESLQIFGSSFNPCLSSTLRNSAGEIKKFKLVISAEKWKTIKPKSQLYGTRKYFKLEPGKWTPIFADKIWEQTKIQCAWKFRSNKVFVQAEAKYYATFKETCKEYNAKLKGFLLRKPQKKCDVIFECIAENLRSNLVHKKKRFLKGSVRNEIASKLLDEKKAACVWRREEADRLMEFGGDIPPTLYDAPVLRKAKQEEIDKRLQLSNTDAISNLTLAKYTNGLGSIHGIGIDPFYCHYWTKEQKLIYKLGRTKENDSFMTVDATGSIAKKIKQADGHKSPHIYLYQCMSVTENGSVPVFQMVSTAQNSAIITFWLLEMLRDGSPVPRMVVCDFGRAILTAVAKAFAYCCDLRGYMQKCYDLVISNVKSESPGCYIRLDVSHLIAMVARWDCLRGKPSKVRQLFIRGIAQIYQMQSVIEAEYVIESLLVIALSEDVGCTEQNFPVESEIRLRYANNLIKGCIDHDDQEGEERNADLDDENAGSWAGWSRSIYERAKAISAKTSAGGIVNAFHNVQVAEKIKNLVAYLPIWTGIMRPHFNIGKTVATSSSVEVEFSNLKSQTFKNLLPMRIDKFILNHLEYLSGRVKSASANRLDQFIPDLPTALNDVENWRGLQKKNKPTDEPEDIMSNDSKDFMYVDTELEQERIEKPEYSRDDSEGWRRHVDVDSASPSNEILNYSEVKSEGSERPIHVNTESPANKINNLKHFEDESEGLKKPNYLSKCPEWDFVQSNTNIGIPLLKNGSLCAPVKVGKVHIMLQRTCGFDSLFQLFASAIAKNENYKIAMQNHDNEFIKFAAGILGNRKIYAVNYTARASILDKVTFFNRTSRTRNLQSIDAQCNVAQLTEYLLHDTPSMTRQTNCTECGHTDAKVMPILYINVGLIVQHGLHLIQEAIDDNNSTRMIVKSCPKCHGFRESMIIHGEHIFLDTSLITDPNYEIKNRTSSSATLDSVTKFIIAGDHTYSLAGLISYSVQGEHYIAFTFSGKWLKYDDTRAKSEFVKSSQVVTPHIIMYVKN